MEFVKPITSDHDLIALAKILNVRIDKIYTIQEIEQPLPKRGAFIVLMRPDEGVGHWVCQNDGEYFDPFGNPPTNKLRNLKYSDIQLQGTYSEYCGIWCLLWLYCKQKKRTDLLKLFSDLDIDLIEAQESSTREQGRLSSDNYLIK